MQPISDDTQLDALFDALSNSRRRGMIYTLAFRPATVSQLAEEQGMSLAAIDRHVAALEAANLIERRKVGRTNFVALNRTALKLAQDYLGQYRTDWGNDSETLENYIASLTK